MYCGKYTMLDDGKRLYEQMWESLNFTSNEFSLEVLKDWNLSLTQPDTWLLPPSIMWTGWKIQSIGMFHYLFQIQQKFHCALISYHEHAMWEVSIYFYFSIWNQLVSNQIASVICSVTTAVFVDFCPTKLNVFSQHVGKKNQMNIWILRNNSLGIEM